MPEKKFKKDEEVTWNTPQGETEGVVMKKTTSTTKIKGHVAKATADHAEYVVKSDKSGKEAVHRPEELKKNS